MAGKPPPREKIDTFCVAYLETFNASEAIKVAGSKAKNLRQAGYDFLYIPVVQQRLKELCAPRIEERAAKVRKVMTEIEAVAHSKITDLVGCGETILHVVHFGGSGEAERETERPFHGVFVKDFDGVPEGAIMALSEISVSDKGNIKIKLHDKMAALEKLCKVYGLYTVDPAEQEEELPSDDDIAAAIITALEEAAAKVDQGG